MRARLTHTPFNYLVRPYIVSLAYYFYEGVGAIGVFR